MNAPRICTLVSGPAVSPVSLDVAKEHLRVDGNSENDIIQFYLDTATRAVEEMAGRLLITQTWDESFRATGKRLVLSKSPVQSLVSVRYYDKGNTEQTATLSDFSLVKLEDRPYIESENWPDGYDRADAITVQYVAGYGDAPADVVATLRHAILLMIGLYYEARMDAEEVKLNPIPMGAESLIGLERGGWYG